MNRIKQQTFEYKYNGNYLNNYKTLISLIEVVTQRIEEPGMKTMGINLVFESRNHRLDMCYSKGYEMANDLQDQIKQKTLSLIESLPEKLQPALKNTNEKLQISTHDIEEQKYEEWIRYAEPWHYFIIEKQDGARLFCLDWVNNAHIEIPVDGYLNKRLKTSLNGVYETIYATINQYHIKNWLQPNKSNT